MDKIKNYFVGSVLARIVTSIFLFLSIMNHPLGYYKFLRWVTTLTALYSAYVSFQKHNQISFSVWLFVLVAILFNPIVPFYLGKASWQYADIAVGLIFMLSTIFIREGRTNYK